MWFSLTGRLVKSLRVKVGGGGGGERRERNDRSSYYL